MKVLLYFTATWNCFEGASSIYFGYIHGNISLFAFGIDSAIEVFSESLVLWHITRRVPQILRREVSCKSPLNAQSQESTLFPLETERKLTLCVGFLLVLFCIFAITGATLRLVEHQPPDTAFWGIVIGGVCIVVMMIIFCLKTKAAVILNSSALMSDAACALGCTKLSMVLFLGSLIYEIAPHFGGPTLWWADSVTAIIIGLMVMHEGYGVMKAARNKATFKGGCCDCASSNSGLSKWLREQFEKQLDKACDPCHHGVDADRCTSIEEQHDDCCGDMA